MTPLGIDPETSRLVAQCLNHYATPKNLYNKSVSDVSAYVIYDGPKLSVAVYRVIQVENQYSGGDGIGHCEKK